MTIEAKGAAPYVPTAEDRLWLLRATEAEGAPVDTVPRVLVNLFMKQRATGSKKTLTDVVRAYSQPVNPRWYPDGDLFRKSVPHPTQQQLTVAANRQQVLSTRTTFLPAVVTAVDRALAEGFASPATDYAVYTLDASRKGYVPLTAAQKGVNRIWTRDAKWGGYTVDGKAGASLLPVLVAVGLLMLVWRS